MKEKIEKYIETVKILKALGKEILNNEESEKFDEYWDWDVFDEIDCMNMHIDCCLSILDENWDRE